MTSSLSRRAASLLSAASLVPALAWSGAGFAQGHDRPPSLGREIDRRGFGPSTTVLKLAWSPDGRTLAILNDNFRVVLYDVERRVEVWEQAWVGLGRQSPDIAFVGKAGMLATSTGGRPRTLDGGPLAALYLRDGGDGSLSRRVEAGSATADRQVVSHGLGWSTDGTVLGAHLDGGGIALHDAATLAFDRVVGKSLDGRGLPAIVKRSAIDVGRDRVVLILADARAPPRPDGVGGQLQIWRRSTDTLLARFDTFRTGIESLVLDPATGHAIVGGDGATLLEAPSPPPAPPGPRRSGRDDGRTLVRAYDPADGALVRTYAGPGGAVRSMSVSPDGRHLVAAKAGDPGRTDAWVVEWEIATGRLVAADSFGQRTIEAVAFHPDGKRLAIADNGTIRIVQLNATLFGE